MRKFTTFVLMVITTILMTLGCAKIDYFYGNGNLVNSKGEYAIVFKNHTPATKALATSTSGTGYDAFNLFVWNSNGTVVMNPYEVDATDTGWEYDGIGSQELKYFSNAADSYSFIGVIPTTKTATLSGETVTVEGVVSAVVDDDRVSGTLTADSPEEFLWAYTNVAKANYGSSVTIPFRHGNSLIYLGFKSDRTDTKLLDYVPGTPEIPAIPDQNDTTDTWFNLKRTSGWVEGSATKTSVNGAPAETAYALPEALVTEIKSYYSVNGGDPGDYSLTLGATAWPSSEIRQLRIVKDVPDEYALNIEHLNGEVTTFFDGFKYLKDNGYDVQPATTGGKPAIWNYVLLDAFVNGQAYTVVGMNGGTSNTNPNYTINVIPGTPAIPGTDPIEGVRLFSADSTGVNNLPADTLYCLHIPHTTVADAVISSTGLTWENRTTSNDVITFSLPATTTLSSSAVFSGTTFYAIPGDTDLNFLVVKLSYIYEGITVYDVRVPIKLPAGGLVEGKYYKYIINILGTSNGTNDPNEAADEKDEILIEDLYPIIPLPVFDDYDEGITQTIDVH